MPWVAVGLWTASSQRSKGKQSELQRFRLPTLRIPRFHKIFFLFLPYFSSFKQKLSRTMSNSEYIQLLRFCNIVIFWDFQTPPSIQILEYHMARLLCIFDVFNSVQGTRTQGPKIESLVALDLKYDTCRNHNAPLDVSLLSEYILEEHLLNQLINLIEYYLEF